MIEHNEKQEESVADCVEMPALNSIALESELNAV